jgi:hypothetical protein
VTPDAWNLAISPPPGAGAVFEATSAAGVPMGLSGGFTIHDDIDVAVIEPLVPRFRFPVLATWTFTCDQGGDFESLMQHLDVGLLGTLRLPNSAAAATAVPATVLETGHLAVDHQRRRGVAGSAWYRGPLVPREVRRRDPVPFFAADQARKVAPDGLEDLSVAGAFELGRLLAISDPRFVAALRAWARDGFAVRRTTSILDRFGLTDQVLAADGGRLGRFMLVGAVAKGLDVMGGVRPEVDFGGLDPKADPGRVADAFGLDVEHVADVLAAGITTTPLDASRIAVDTEQSFDALVQEPQVLGGLTGSLAATVDQITRDARATRGPVGGVAPTPTPARRGRGRRRPPPPTSLLDELWPEDEEKA